MIAVVVILAVVALAALVAALVARSRLAAQRTLTAAAEERSTQQAGELATTAAALQEAGRERAAAEEQAAAARREAEEAAADRQAAEQRAAAAEQRIAQFAAAHADGGIDPDVLWTLEQARSERTWRHSVAPGPDAVSVFADASDPLLEALQVELDAAREEVGAIVELEAELPPGVTAAGSVLALRAAQELLARAVRRAEITTLHVHAEGPDLIVAVRLVDENDEPLPVDPLELPPSLDIEPVEDGVRIRDAIRAGDAAP